MKGCFLFVCFQFRIQWSAVSRNLKETLSKCLSWVVILIFKCPAQIFCEFYITNDGIMLFCLLCRTCGDFGTRRTTFWWSAVHYLLIVCKLVCNVHHFYSIVQYHTSILCMRSDPMLLLKREMILLWKCLSYSAIHIPNLHPLDAAFFLLCFLLFLRTQNCKYIIWIPWNLTYVCQNCQNLNFSANFDFNTMHRLCM